MTSRKPTVFLFLAINKRNDVMKTAIDFNVFAVSVLGSDKFIKIAQRISIKSVRNFWGCDSFISVTE